MVLRSLKNTFVERLKRESFLVTRFSILVNPFYIIRRGLFAAISRFAPTITGRVMDFGCGSKPYESLFTSASQYTGVDIDVSGHDHRSSKIDVFYDGKTLPFEDQEFDAVVSFEVLEHVFNIDDMLREINRVLKPNGQLLISIPFAWDEHEVPYDFARYTSFGIAAILERHGFEVIETVKTTPYVLAVFQMLIAYIHQHVIPREGKIGLFAQIVVICPVTLFALLLNRLLPKRYDYFNNVVILGRKN